MTVRATSQAVYLVSSITLNKLEQNEIWVYGRIPLRELSNDAAALESSLKAVLPLPISKSVNRQEVEELRVCDSYKAIITGQDDLITWGDFTGLTELSRPNSFIQEPTYDGKVRYSAVAVCNEAILFVREM